MSTGIPQDDLPTLTRALVDPEQLDIFIPLHRGERLRRWADIARQEGLHLEEPASISAFAGWLQANGHAPAGLAPEALTLLVAVMRDYERDGFWRADADAARA